MLARQDSPDAEVPRIMIGYWHSVIREFLLPAIVSGEQSWIGGKTEPYHLPDPAETIAAYTDDNRAIQAWAMGRAESPPDYEPDSFSQLSEEGRETMSMLVIGASAWFRGMERTNTLTALNDALLAISLGEEPPPDPVTGQPFLWDSATRTLSAPEGVSEIDPVTLP
ncbi:hypothetical protein [Haloferula sargassicola]|uniref:Uncharacterized protein n=1 Tax=Haloferula sargassicola TaxID=490096 RepID=A0ABP9ULR7_9BACT